MAWIVTIVIASISLAAWAQASCHEPWPGTCKAKAVQGRLIPNTVADGVSDAITDGTIPEGHPMYYVWGDATFAISLHEGKPSGNGSDEPFIPVDPSYPAGAEGYLHVHVDVRRDHQDRIGYALELHAAFGLEWTGESQWSFEAYDAPNHTAHFDFPFRIDPKANLTHTHVDFTIIEYYGSGPTYDEWAEPGDEWIGNDGGFAFDMQIQSGTAAAAGPPWLPMVGAAAVSGVVGLGAGWAIGRRK